METSDLVNGEDDNGNISDDRHHTSAIPDFADFNAVARKSFVPRFRDRASSEMLVQTLSYARGKTGYLLTLPYRATY